MLYFQITPDGDETVCLTADSQRLISEIACPDCLSLLPAHSGSSIDIESAWDGYPEYMIPIMDIHVPVIVMQEALAAWICQRLPNHELGVMSCDPRCEVTYRTLAVSTNLRCNSHSWDMSVFRPCPSCGRQLGGPGANGEEWISANEVAGRDIVARSHGARLVVSTNLLETMPFELRSQLQLEAIEVR